jgi:ribosomal-protein-alanine N-acetyltransferase
MRREALIRPDMEQKVLKTDAPVSIRPATRVDLDFIMDIEHKCFPSPWSRQTLLEELEGKTWSHVNVAELRDTIAGYIVYWIVLNEVHLLNLAVHPNWRRIGIASALIHHLVHTAKTENTTEIYLEVRVSNRSAQTLYRKFGFKPIGIRHGYYSDNDEDAVVMCLRREQ